MPARAMHGVEMPASLLIDLHRDPEAYAKKVDAISKREGAARDAEARAGEREKLAKAAEAKAVEAEAGAEQATAKADEARQRSEDAKVALARRRRTSTRCSLLPRSDWRRRMG